MARARIFDDELIVKRVFDSKARASKSTYNYKQKHTQQHSRSNEVVVKITGNSKNLRAALAHINYITRKDQLDIKIDENEIYKGKEDIKEFKKLLAETIPTESEFEKRELMHITFSMRGDLDVPDKVLEEATIKTLKDKYPDNLSAFVLHKDTSNPHVHAVLMVKDKTGKRIDLRKDDLSEIRRKFAQNLRSKGIDAKATDRSKDYAKQEHKNHYYEVVDWGEAKYKFSKDPTARDSFFVSYKTKNGTTELWSNDLKRVIEENNIKKGEFARFKIVNKEEVTIKSKKKIGTDIVEYQKFTHRSIWDASVEGREKDLPDPPTKRVRKQSYRREMRSSLSEFMREKKANAEKSSLKKDFSKFKKKDESKERD